MSLRNRTTPLSGSLLLEHWGPLDLRFTVNVDPGLPSKLECGDPARLSSFVSSTSGLEVQTAPKVSEAAGLVVSGATAGCLQNSFGFLLSCHIGFQAGGDAIEGCDSNPWLIGNRPAVADHKNMIVGKARCDFWAGAVSVVCALLGGILGKGGFLGKHEGPQGTQASNGYFCGMAAIQTMGW
jgi:hypothetical protein